MKKVTIMNAILKVNQLTKTYGKKGEKQYQALKGINFELNRGEFVGIMGASGSGKTTLLNILSTLDKPTSGNVVINGKDITTLKKNQMADFRGKEIGFIFQDFNLLDNLTNRENIALPLSLQNVKAREINNQVEAIASRLNITQILDKYPAEVSGGQKQRIASARALVHNPSILFGDEPTGALDSKSAKMLLERFDYLNNELSATILMVTHDAFSASYSKKVYMLSDGEIKCQLNRGNDRKEFYGKIIDLLATLGGAK